MLLIIDTVFHIRICSDFQSRILIRTNRTRSLLLRYAENHRRTKKKTLSSEEFQDLLTNVREESSEIYDLLIFIHESAVIEDHTYSTESDISRVATASAVACPRLWVPFVEAIGCATPACGFLHQDPELIAALQRFIDSKGRVEANTLAIFENKFPVLHALIISFEGMVSPDVLFPVLNIILEKANDPFSNEGIDSINLDLSKEDAERETRFSHWPSISRKRRRGHYQSDKTKNSKACNKISRGHPSLLPGIFTMFCEHGKHF